MFAHFDGGGTTVTRGHHPNALPLCTVVAAVQRPESRRGMPSEEAGEESQCPPAMSSISVEALSYR